MSSKDAWHILEISTFLNAVHFFPSLAYVIKIFLSLFSSILKTQHTQKALPSIRQETFDISHDTGFFPRKPLPKLSGRYEIWERALSDATHVLSLGEDVSNDAMSKQSAGALWRSNIQSWPVLDINDIIIRGDDSLLQRAHLVLAWLTHYFVHSIPDADTLASIHIPESIAVPLVEVSRLLGTAPVLTYADTVLYNWDLIDPSKPVSADNITYSNLFSGTEDEKNFYLISAKTELAGAGLFQIIDRYNGLRDATDFASLSAISKDLSRVKNIINDISVIMQELRSNCNPHVFYWAVRPWFDGADAKGPDGPEWIYDGVSSARLLDTSGPSGGQSSTMHAIDIFLDIDHRLRQRRYPAPSTENKRSDKGFMDRMRRYMPGKHREYLLHLAAAPRPVRELAQRHQILRSSYDDAVTALKDLRDEHIRIVCLYIVNMKRNGSRGMCPMMKQVQMNERKSSPVRGTGGTELALLLKAGRDATKRATLQSK